MRILLLSAYEAKSHQYWAQSLITGLDEFEWTYLALPARHFAWRVGGNALSFAFSPEYQSALQGSYDLVIATSMTDCVGLKALCPQLQRIPWMLYFHENQFAYPENHQQQGLVEIQMKSLYSAFAADYCLFNSDFNRQSFLQGAKKLLDKLPDFSESAWVNKIAERSQVLPVPIDVPAVKATPKNTPLSLVWAARWEHDKGPKQLLTLLEVLEEQQLDYRISILGEAFRQVPETFTFIKQRFANRIQHMGYLPSREAYLTQLAQADVVISTALHEFQGVSVLEAVALGCTPLLPDRQVYSEWFDEAFLYPSVVDDPVQEAQGAYQKLVNLIKAGLPCPNVEAFQARTLHHKYRQCIQQRVSQA
ncbi:tRNA-queuosine alpha-mannosyltransferase domain-containing protein [Marinomonas epiphytica]